MLNWNNHPRYQLSILETAQEMAQVEELQRQVWSGDDTEVVPAHMLLAAVHNGGLAVGAYDLGEPAKSGVADSADEVKKSISHVVIPAGVPLVGFVFGFPGLVSTADGLRAKHCSHMMGVHPEHRDRGIGFALKRAQWQMVRQQGLAQITWTYDPLLSRNAYLNIARLGAVCNTYLRDVYGSLRDDLNVGLPSDRFQVDWWTNSRRVTHRLSKAPRGRLDLAHYLAAETGIINPTVMRSDGWPAPAPGDPDEQIANTGIVVENTPLWLVEIPADFWRLKSAAPSLAQEWRAHSRALFERLFERGYLVTDFIHLPGTYGRSFYVLTYGESTL